MQQYQKYIDKNRIYLEARLIEANSSYDVIVRGFQVFSAKEAFDELLNKGKLYNFPLCIYLIQFGVGVKKDKMFAEVAFRHFLPDATHWCKFPTLAYFYAYGENRHGDILLGESVLERLAFSGFGPAMMTRGDLAWMQGNSRLARQWYDAATNAGHIVAKTRRATLFYSPAKLFASRAMIAPQVLFSGLLGKQIGPNFLYLDVYGFKRYP